MSSSATPEPQPTPATAPPAATPAAGASPAGASPSGASPNGKPATLKVEQFAPIACGATVVRDTAGKLAGRIQAQVAPQGLILYPAAGDPTVVKPGAGVKYLGDNRMVVTLPEEANGSPREISLRLRRGFSHKNMLTLDTVAFLNGDIAKLNSSYNIPFWMFLPALLPLGLPFVVFHYMVDEKHPPQERMYELIGATVAGIALAALCLLFAFSEKTKTYIRVLACLLCTGLAYAFTSALVGAVPAPNLYEKVFGPLPEDARALWKPYRIEEEQCEVWVTEEPKLVGEQERALTATEKATFNKYQAEAAEAKFMLAVAPMPESLRAAFLDDRARHEQQFKEDFPEASDLAYDPKVEFWTQAETGYKDILGREVRGKLPGGERVIRQIFVLRDKVYVMTFQAKAADTRAYFHEQFLRGLFRDGLGLKRPAPGAAGGGGAPRPQGSGGGGSGRRRRGGGFGSDASSTRSAESRPSEASPAETKPGETKPAEPKGSPAQSRPAENGSAGKPPGGS